MEPRGFEGECQRGAELRRLREGAPRQRLARDAGGKAEIVFDASGGAGLPPDGALVEHQHRQALGGGVNRGGKAGGPGSDDGHVVEGLGIEVWRYTKASARLDVAGPL